MDESTRERDRIKSKKNGPIRSWQPSMSRSFTCFRPIHLLPRNPLGPPNPSISQCIRIQANHCLPFSGENAARRVTWKHLNTPYTLLRNQQSGSPLATHSRPRRRFLHNDAEQPSHTLALSHKTALHLSRPGRHRSIFHRMVPSK